MRLERADRRWALAVFLALSLLYWLDHCRSFGAGDSAQHVLCALTWSVPRPPGYPLYVFLAHLVSRLPFASPESWVNGSSGLLHAAAAALFFLLLRRQKCSAPAALAATALMSLSGLYWYYSEVAEVRALNDSLAVLAAYLILTDASLHVISAVVGLGVSHHPTYVLLLPAYLWRIAQRKKLESADIAAAACTAAAACSAPYVLLWVRLRTGAEPLYNPDNVRSAMDVLNLFLRKNTGGLASFAAGTSSLSLAAFEPARALRETGWFAGLVWRDLPAPGILLAAAGAYRLWRKDRRAVAFWALWILGTLLPVVLISSQEVRRGDLDYLRAMVTRFYLPPMIGLFALAGFGADWLVSRSRAAFGWALAAACVLCPLLLSPVDLSRADPLLSYAKDILRASGPRDMILLASDEANFALLYLQDIAHATDERVFLVPSLFAHPPYVERLAREHPDLNLPRDGRGGLSHSVSRWMDANPGRPLDGEPTMRDSLARAASACFPHGVLVRVAPRLPPLDAVAAQARRFLDGSAAESVPSWGLRPWTQEVYLLKAYAMILEFYGPFLRRDQDEALRARARKDFLAVLSVR